MYESHEIYSVYCVSFSIFSSFPSKLFAVVREEEDEDEGTNQMSRYRGYCVTNFDEKNDDLTL